jgi:hypothetical protein
MPSAESSSVKTIFRVDYKATLDFYDKVNSSAQLLSDTYKNWQTDRLKVVLKDFPSRCSITISHANFFFTQDALNSAEKERSRIDEVIKTLPKAFGKDVNERVGLRRKYLIAVEMDYKDLHKLVSSKLLNSNPELTQSIYPWARDFHLVLASPEAGFRGLTLGPIIKEQFRQFLEPDDSNFEIGDIGLMTGQWFESYPQTAIFVDCDYVRADIKSDKLLDFYTEARESHKTLVENVQHYLLGIS